MRVLVCSLDLLSAVWAHWLSCLVLAEGVWDVVERLCGCVLLDSELLEELLAILLCP